MNRVILIGRLVKDADLREFAGSGKSALNFTIAVNRDYANDKNEKKADFIPVSYWSKSGENLRKYLVKGRLVYVTGRITIRSYESNEGVKKYITSIMADEIQFLDSRKIEEIV